MFAVQVPHENMRIESALRDGIVADWDAAEALMDYSFKSCLGCSPVDHPLLMAEPSFNPTASRTKLTELAFEKFGVPGAVLSHKHHPCIPQHSVTRPMRT